MMLSLDTAYRSFGGEVEASSTPTICRLSDSRRACFFYSSLEEPEIGELSRSKRHICASAVPAAAKRCQRSSKLRCHPRRRLIG